MNGDIEQYACMAALVLSPVVVHAAGFDIVAGPTVTASERTTAAAFASMFGERPADDHVHVEPIVTLGGIDSRRTHADDLDHKAWLAGGGVRIVSAGHHWFASEQVAATSTRTDALSSRFEFMTSGGREDGRFIVLLRHIPNGRLIGGGKNLGETMLLGGVRW